MGSILNEKYRTIFDAVINTVDAQLLLVDPTSEMIEKLVNTAADLNDPPNIDLLATETALKDAMADFLVASPAAELVESKTLTIRILESPPNNSLLITDDLLYTVIAAGASVGALEVDDPTFVGAANEEYRERWGNAEPYTLRTPPLERIQDTLDAQIGEETRTDFETALSSLETLRGGDGVDEVAISLLVAAKNEIQFYDISKWGEDVGLASKATFSRAKTRLEDAGLISTEKVPIDIGRPRLRLHLEDAQLRETEVKEFPRVAQSHLN